MLKRLMVTAGLGALIAAAHLAPVRAQHVGPQNESYRSTARFARDAGPIPFELFRGTRIFFQGTVNGQPAMMMLDSGASSSVLNRSFAQRIGAREGQAIQARGAGGTEEGSIAPGVTLEAGSLTVSGASVLVLDLDGIARQIGHPIDVILGMETFRAGIVDIDFPQHRISFMPAQGFTPPAGAIAVPVTEADGGRTIPVSVNGAPPVAADLDIGNGSALILSRSYWTSNPAIAGLPFASATAGGVGGRVPKRLVTLPSVSVGGHTFQAVPALLNEGANDLPETGANIGIDLLQRFRMLFHYGRSTLYLVPNPAAIAEPLPKNRLGLRLELAGDRLRVAEVIAGSPGAEAGWRAGDEVISVNGTLVDPRFYYRDDVRFSTMPAGTRVELVRADGTSLPVTLRDFY